MSAQATPNNKAVHIVEKTMPVDQLIMIMYNAPSPEVYDHFKMVNSHIKNGMVQVGQIVLLSPEGASECTIEEAEFLKIAKAVDNTLLKLDSSEKKLLAKRYELLSGVASYNGLLLGITNTAWNAHTNQVKTILKEIERAYITSYKSTGNLNNQNFFQTRKILFNRLDAALRRFAQPTMGGGLVSGDIRSNLGLSSKSIVQTWSKQQGNVTTVPNFSKNYAVVAEMSRNLKRVGYVGIALTGIDAAANIQKACTVGDDATCRKAKYTQTGKAAVSIGGGIVGGGLATWGVCTIVFGIPSGGTSAFWCAVVAGAGGGYAGGVGGALLGEKGGELLYRTNSGI